MHDVLVLAGSSVLAMWVVELARSIAESAATPVEFHFCDGNDVLPDLGRGEGSPRIVIIVGPEGPTIDAIASGTSPVIGLLDDPVDSVRFLVEKRGIALLEALRVQTKYACAHEHLYQHPRVLLVRRGDTAPARAIVDAILGVAGRGLDASACEAVRTTHGGPAPGWSLEEALARKVDGYAGLGRASDVVSGEDAAAIRGALSPLIASAITRDVAFAWLRPVFILGDDPTLAVAPVIDVTGAARIVFFGPYFHLPTGAWTVRLLIAFSDRVRGTPFQMRLLCRHDVLTQVVMRPAEGGAFVGEFPVDHTRADGWLEVQFCTLEGMIEGEVALRRIEFRRRHATSSGVDADDVATRFSGIDGRAAAATTPPMA